MKLAVTLGCPAGNPDTPPGIALGELKINVLPGSKAAYLAKVMHAPQLLPHPQNKAIAKEGTALLAADPWHRELKMVSMQVRQADWVPVRDRYTGVLIARRVSATAYAQKPGDEAGLYRHVEVVFERDASGGALSLQHNGDTVELYPCSKVPK